MTKRAKTDWLADLDRFYALLDELAERVGGWRQLGHCSGQMAWPERGVYFLTEPGERRSTAPGARRVVRVGTHALKAGARSALWGRLQQHRGTGSGSGNHRGSVFRKHAGDALLEKHGTRGQYPDWGRGQNASRQVREHERAWETLVSEYLAQMEVLCLAVEDEPGPDSDRATLERNAIGLLSHFHEPLDPPSPDWLGLYSLCPCISLSGLWNVQATLEPYDAGFLDLMGGYVLSPG
jgi:hypothetical protein